VTAPSDDAAAPEPGIEVHECLAVTDEVVDAMKRLIPQLSSSNPPPDRAELEEIVASPATTLFVARHSDRIVGALTLVAFRVPTGVRTRIEDVVVDETLRGRRVGERLSETALEAARGLGARSTDLTSRPSREAANRLYARMGFERRESNVYRYAL
jgi:ribosomal protein S18 acetylase RimI-like enzyme